MSNGAPKTSAAPVDDRLAALVRQRSDLVSQTGDRVLADLESLAVEIGAQTVSDLEAHGVGDLRVAVDTTRLDDILRVIDAVRVERADAEPLTMDSARASMFDDLRRLAGKAEECAIAAGIDRADASLDQKALKAAIEAKYGDVAAWWMVGVEQPCADTILTALHDARILPISEVAARISDQLGIPIRQARMQAAQQAAHFDRWVSAEIASQADPSGDSLTWALIGPVDGIERPFCRHLTGLFLPLALVLKLNNAIVGPNPIYSGGGPNCRHHWQQASAEFWTRRGLTLGTLADVLAANAAAAIGGR